MKMKKTLAALALAGAGLAGTSVQAAPINDGGLQAGSLVLYPLFQLQGDGYLTQIRLTNNHPTSDVTVHLVRVCGGVDTVGNGKASCDASNREVELTHNQTKVWNVQSFFQINEAACETGEGFIVAYAVDPDAASVPIEWNHLSGSSYIRRTAAPFPNATSGAQAVVFEGDPGNAVAQGAPLPGAMGGAFPTLPFDGAAYQQLGTVLHSDFIATTNAANPTQGRRTAIALLTLDIDAGQTNDETFVALDWYNEAEDLFSNSMTYVCHGYSELQDISGSFTLGGLGSFFGTLYATPFGTDAIQGQIKELEPNRETLRNWFHDANLRSTTFTGR